MRLTKVQRETLRHFGKLAERMGTSPSLSQVAESMDKSPQAVHCTMQQLLRDGHVYQPRRDGTYVLTDDGRAIISAGGLDLVDGWASRLDKAMRDQNISQSQIAAEVGVSQPTVSRWASGLMVPSISHAQAVGEMLGVELVEERASEARRLVGVEEES